MKNKHKKNKKRANKHKQKPKQRDLGKWIKKRNGRYIIPCNRCHKSLYPETLVYSYEKGFGYNTKHIYECYNCARDKQGNIPEDLKPLIDFTLISLQKNPVKCYSQDCVNLASKWIEVIFFNDETPDFRLFFNVCSKCAKERFSNKKIIEQPKNDTFLVGGMITQKINPDSSIEELKNLQPFDEQVIRKFGNYLPVFTENINYNQMGLFCQFDHCIEQMPLPNKENTYSCPVFGHTCPSKNLDLINSCILLRTYEMEQKLNNLDFKSSIPNLTQDNWEVLLLDLYQGQTTYAGGIIKQMKFCGWDIDETLIRNSLKGLGNKKLIKWERAISKLSGFTYYKLFFPPYGEYNQF